MRSQSDAPIQDHGARRNFSMEDPSEIDTLVSQACAETKNNWFRFELVWFVSEALTSTLLYSQTGRRAKSLKFFTKSFMPRSAFCNFSGVMSCEGWRARALQHANHRRPRRQLTNPRIRGQSETRYPAVQQPASVESAARRRGGQASGRQHETSRVYPATMRPQTRAQRPPMNQQRPPISPPISPRAASAPIAGSTPANGQLKEHELQAFS